MSYIKLKGSKENIEAEKLEAQAIKRIFENDNFPKDYPIKTETWSGIKGNVDYVVITNERVKQDGNSIIKNYDDEYKKYRHQKLSLTAEQRGKNLSMFELFWWGATGKKEIPEDVKNKTIEIQTKFFVENPKRIYCSPILFKKIIPERKNLTIWQGGAFDVVERCVGTDMRYARYNL